MERNIWKNKVQIKEKMSGQTLGTGNSQKRKPETLIFTYNQQTHTHQIFLYIMLAVLREMENVSHCQWEGNSVNYLEKNQGVILKMSIFYNLAVSNLCVQSCLYIKTGNNLNTRLQGKWIQSYDGTTTQQLRNKLDLSIIIAVLRTKCSMEKQVLRFLRYEAFVIF